MALLPCHKSPVLFLSIFNTCIIRLILCYLFQTTIETCPRCHQSVSINKIVLECRHIFCKACALKMKRVNIVTNDGKKVWNCEINCPLCECTLRFKHSNMLDYMVDISFIHQDNSYYLPELNAFKNANTKITELIESGQLKKCGFCSMPGKRIPPSMYKQFNKCTDCKLPPQSKKEKRPPVICPDCRQPFYCTEECFRMVLTQHKRECIKIQECLHVINSQRKCLKSDPKMTNEQKFDGTYDVYVMKRGNSSGKVFTFRNLANREFFYMKFDLKDL